MYIIVGLGNPTMKYSKTKHNIGFDAVDQISKDYKIKINESKHKAMTGKGLINGEKVLLVKPITFMNLSGEAVKSAIDFYKEDPKTKLIVIYDDVSLEVGRIRIRKKGSSGGHNGIKNIIAHIGHDEFIRIRVGIGESKEYGDMVNHVLSRFEKKERKIIDEKIEVASEAVKTIISEGIENAMNKFNS